MQTSRHSDQIVKEVCGLVEMSAPSVSFSRGANLIGNMAALKQLLNDA